jgi:hypothetical protein
VRELLEATETELKAKIEVLDRLQIEEASHEVEITNLLSWIDDLEKLDEKKSSLLNNKMEEIETLRGVLKDTIRQLEDQINSNNSIKEKIQDSKSIIEAHLKEEHEQVDEKDSQIKELHDAVNTFASDVIKLSQDEAKARSIISTLTEKIHSLEAEKMTNTQKLDQEEGELDMYKIMLIDWRKKLVEQTQINDVFKNKITQEGQILAMKACMWPSNQFGLMLSEVKRLDELPSLVQNQEIGYTITEINNLLTDLVVQEEDFIVTFNKLTKSLKEENRVMIDGMTKILECSSPSNQDNRCLPLAIESSQDLIEDLNRRAKFIDTSEEKLGEMCNQILTILDKITVNLASISLILETAEAGREEKIEISPELDHHIKIVNSLSQKISRIAGNFDETVIENKKRLSKSGHKLLLSNVLDILKQFKQIESFDEHTPRPDQSIKDLKVSSNLQNIFVHAADLKAKLEAEDKGVPRAIELLSVLTQRVIFLEEERRAQYKLAIKEKLELLKLLLKASTIISIHSKVEFLSEIDIEELTTATSNLAMAFLDHQMTATDEQFRQNLESLSRIANKLLSKCSHSMSLSSLINRVVIDLQRLKSLNIKNSEIVVQDLLEQAIRLNELHISYCIEASQFTSAKISTQDEHLEARAWDSRKIQELERTVESLQAVLHQKDHKLKEYVRKLSDLSHTVKHHKSQTVSDETSRLKHYNEQITLMRYRINELETALLESRGQQQHGSPNTNAGPGSHPIFAQNDALIRRLHEADSNIGVLREANHTLVAQLADLGHQLDSLTISPHERRLLEDRILKLEGELALAKHRHRLEEGRLKDRVHQLLKSVFVLRLRLAKKLAEDGQSIPRPGFAGDQAQIEESMVTPTHAKVTEFQMPTRTSHGGHRSHHHMTADRQ